MPQSALCCWYGHLWDDSWDIPERKKTTTTELTMENQWIWTSLMVRYVSHRDAHFTSLSCTVETRGSAVLPLYLSSFTLPNVLGNSTAWIEFYHLTQVLGQSYILFCFYFKRESKRASARMDNMCLCVPMLRVVWIYSGVKTGLPPGYKVF